MKYATCGWCLKLLEAPDQYDSRQHTAYCSVACQQADWVFKQWQSAEEINRRRHYDELTKGGDT